MPTQAADSVWVAAFSGDLRRARVVTRAGESGRAAKAVEGAGEGKPCGGVEPSRRPRGLDARGVSLACSARHGRRPWAQVLRALTATCQR
jgi:hypothetical protein